MHKIKFHFRYVENGFSDLIVIQRKLGTQNTIRLTYEEAEYTTKSVLRKKITDTVEFSEGELFKSIELSLFDQDESDLNYPKLFSVSLIRVQLVDDLNFLNISQSLIDEASDILPQISLARNTTFIRFVDDRPLIEFEPNSKDVFANFGHNLPQTVTLNLTLSHFRLNSSIKGYFKQFLRA